MIEHAKILRPKFELVLKAFDSELSEIGLVYFLQIAFTNVQTFCNLPDVPRIFGIFSYPSS